MNQLKLFNVEEANALIPSLTRELHQLQEKRNAVLGLEAEIDALELVTEPAGKDKKSPLVEARLDDYENAVNDFYAGIDQIHQMGCFLKDVDMGLVDFYSVHEGRVVYLCWKLGEERITCWHEIGRGYTQREPLR